MGKSRKSRSVVTYRRLEATQSATDSEAQSDSTTMERERAAMSLSLSRAASMLTNPVTSEEITYYIEKEKHLDLTYRSKSVGNLNRTANPVEKKNQ